MGCLVFLLCAIFEYAVLLLMKRIIVRKKRNLNLSYEEDDNGSGSNKKRQDSSATMTTMLDDITDLPSLTPPGSPVKECEVVVLLLLL